MDIFKATTDSAWIRKFCVFKEEMLQGQKVKYHFGPRLLLSFHWNKSDANRCKAMTECVLFWTKETHAL